MALVFGAGCSGPGWGNGNAAAVAYAQAGATVVAIDRDGEVAYATAALIAANLNGVFLTCKHVLPIMLGRGKGAIANFSSLAAIRWTGYLSAAYCAAKAGVNQLTIGLALQYAAQGIRANDLLPGFIDTPPIHQQISGQYASDAAMIAARDAASPTGRVGTPWDVANAAVFFASEAAGSLNGVCLPVDGGLSCRAA